MVEVSISPLETQAQVCNLTNHCRFFFLMYVVDSASGGSINLSAGSGKSKQTSNGGDGGSIIIFGGEASGKNANKDTGGQLHLEGGTSATSSGGKIEIYSGKSIAASSGGIEMQTANAGSRGVSGRVTIRTGNTTFGPSGAMDLSTGRSKSGAGGDIRITVGSGNKGDGGNLHMSAGEATYGSVKGGDIELVAGHGSSTQNLNGGKGGRVLIEGGSANGGGSDDKGWCISFKL